MRQPDWAGGLPTREKAHAAAAAGVPCGRRRDDDCGGGVFPIVSAPGTGSRREPLDGRKGNAMSDMLDRTAVSANAIVLLIARILLSAIFLISGFNKLTHLGATSTNFADRYHLPAAFALAVVAGLVELFGGLLVLVGLKTRWASLHPHRGVHRPSLLVRAGRSVREPDGAFHERHRDRWRLPGPVRGRGRRDQHRPKVREP
jgi:DoxX-like protein